LTGVHHRQAIETKPRNWVTDNTPPGGKDHAARRFRFRNPKTTQKQHESPNDFECLPGDFWKISRNPEFQT